MGWHRLGAAGSTRDLWVDPTNEHRPEYGQWLLPDGRDIDQILGLEGPLAVGVPVWWEQGREASGKRQRDMLWQTSACGLKLISHRMRDVLAGCGASLETFEVDIRLRNGEPVTGYVGVLEDNHVAGPVHGYRRGKDRIASFTVNDEVCGAVEDARLTGLEIRPSTPDVAFPGDAADLLDDDPWERFGG